jgi:GNAT superfamily N-acetyltransferase
MTPELSLEPQLAYRNEPDGSTRVDLMFGDVAASWLWIVPFTIRIGIATVRMDGIGGVNTREEYRRRGYSRRVLEAAVERMRAGDAALSMLYGIPHFYPKFGYTTAGPDQFVSLTAREEVCAMPPGWHARPFADRDLPAVRELYEHGTADGVGCAVRPEDAGPWRRLARPKGGEGTDCRVIVDPSVRVRGYVWQAAWHWSAGFIARDHPDALVIAEAMADSSEAADAVLAACQSWAGEEAESRSTPIREIIFSLPPEGHVATAAMYHSARFERHYVACGQSMVRVLDLKRLLDALSPELTRRMQATGTTRERKVELQTDLGNLLLSVSGEGVVAVNDSSSGFETPPVSARRQDVESPSAAEPIPVRLPQVSLARLVLGAFPPGDVISRLAPPPAPTAGELLSALFPLRHPHMYLPDRY